MLIYLHSLVRTSHDSQNYSIARRKDGRRCTLSWIRHSLSVTRTGITPKLLNGTLLISLFMSEWKRNGNLLQREYACILRKYSIAHFPECFVKFFLWLCLMCSTEFYSVIVVLYCCSCKHVNMISSHRFTVVVTPIDVIMFVLYIPA